jgi:hypothetical protein
MTTLPVAAATVGPPAPAASTAPRADFAAALDRRASALARTPASPPTATAPPSAAPGAHPALAALHGVERAQARLDGVLAAARAGRTFTAAELLALQAEAYRCSQTVDLAAKLVEQGAQSLKQALNTPL